MWITRAVKLACLGKSVSSMTSGGLRVANPKMAVVEATQDRPIRSNATLTPCWPSAGLCQFQRRLGTLWSLQAICDDSHRKLPVVDQLISSKVAKEAASASKREAGGWRKIENRIKSAQNGVG